ncbi:Proline oxidase [Ceraceosorus bombacis]|uniref:Proline dehydrogenase n=1 Tax=Ceraceosorus bombacis TaxID=401625 RepID=A0A0P1BMW1_9BASI|nr:Proline oxidase [Ceraceosorus bombacis]
MLWTTPQAGPDRPMISQPTSTLIRSYIVWSLVSLPYVTDIAPDLIQWSRSTSLPGVPSFATWLVRKTFFGQFVGGETVEECVPLIRSLAIANVGTMLNHSCEVKHAEMCHSERGSDNAKTASSAVHLRLIEAAKHSIQVASDLASGNVDASGCPASDGTDEVPPGSIMVAIKLSGLLADSSVLERASASIVPREHFSDPPAPAPPRISTSGAPLVIPMSARVKLTEEDISTITELWRQLRGVALLAKEKKVRLLIDAEYSWYQPAIDAMYDTLAQEFNALSSASAKGHESPLVFNTYQAYLRRTPSHLASSLQRAKNGQYGLGVKLVRGAYVEIENNAWQKHQVATPPVERKLKAARAKEGQWNSPVWSSKTLTDECYDACAERLLQEIADEVDRPLGKRGGPARLSVVFASHNVSSAVRALDMMQRGGLVQAAPTEQNVSLPDDQPPRGLVPIDSINGRILFAQLLGMADPLTRMLQHAFKDASSKKQTPLVSKYVPWGALDDVMPYLMRRAQENKSLSTEGAKNERRAIRSELRVRLAQGLFGIARSDV